MAFYIIPPLGNSQLGTLMEDTKTRLIYLCELCQRWGDAEKVQRLLPDNPELAYSSDSLIEGTKRDIESYFILKLASLSERRFEAFLTEAETHFFEHRLACGGHLTMKRAVAEALKQSAIAMETWKMTGDQQEFMTQLIHILQTLMRSGMSGCQNRELCQHSIMVPWTLVLPLVKTRSVELIRGQAVVECEQVKFLLCCLFNQLSTVVHKQLVTCKAEEAVQDDERLSYIIRRLHVLFRTRWLGGSVRAIRSLKHEELERESKYFPLCMKELFRKLQQKNRLRHHERYRFTIFLKDIGLPLEENIALWEKHYSRSSGGGCQHTWESHWNRYVYSIRHIYGLEGARYIHSTHNCSKLQSIQPSPQDMGGCPFSSYNFEELLPQLIPPLGTNNRILEAITREVSIGRPTAACQTLMAFMTHIKNMNRTLNNPTSGESLVCAEDHVNVTRNVSRAAGSRSFGNCARTENHVNVPSNVSGFVRSLMCAENHVDVSSDVRRCARENAQSNASRSVGSLACAENPGSVQSDVSRCAGTNVPGVASRSVGSLVYTENPVVIPSNVFRSARENQESELVHLVTGEQPQCPGLSTSGCSGCHMNRGQDDMLSATGSDLPSCRIVAQGASPNLATMGPGSCREDNSMRQIVSNECSTRNIAPVCDIEDIMGLIPKCVFRSPLQYYLKIVNNKS